LDPASAPRIAESAAAVERILAKGQPIYGVNTGFGKLASVRIEDADLATLQRNIVLPHAAGVGEPIAPPIARLMMALKLANLARGASGVKPDTIALLGAMLDRALTPVIPSQVSVGASGDLAPLAHLAAALIGVGEIIVDGTRKPALFQCMPSAFLPGYRLRPGEQQVVDAGSKEIQRRLIDKFAVPNLLNGAVNHASLRGPAPSGSHF
jgi:histidine ammonia-lyase